MTTLRGIARPVIAHGSLAFNQPKGPRLASFAKGIREAWRECGSGKPGRNEPLGRIERVSLQGQFESWVSRALAWIARKLLARALGHAQQQPSSASREPRAAIPLHRDPWCGTYVSPEISFPLEQSGQVLHFCSEQCRARYQGTAKRAASA